MYLRLFCSLCRPATPVRKAGCPSLYLLTQRHIPIRNFPNEIHIGILDHNMEMLYCMHRLQRPPVLKPNHLCITSMKLATPYHSPEYLEAPMLTCSLGTLPQNVTRTNSSISPLAFSVKSSVAGSSSSTNFVHTTRCTISFSTPYGP